MTNPMASITFDRSQSLPLQITQQVRKLLATGQLEVGSRLPSTQELARLWDTHVPYVHKGLKPLTQEGWLVRRHGSGTFVHDRPKRLKTIGLYYYAGMLSAPEHRFMRSVHQCLVGRIEADGLQCSVWNDPRPPEESETPWKALIAAIAQGEVDAVIVPNSNPAHTRWLSKLPVPVALLGTGNQDNCVYWDNGQFSRLAVEALAENGCKSAGLISAWPAVLSPDETRESNGVGRAVFEIFCSEAKQRGLRTDDFWTITSDRLPRASHMSAERWGYEAFMRLWALPERPDGLVVITDAEALGVTMAIMETGIKVPEELRVVFHRNEEVHLFCPLRVTAVVSRAGDAAPALLELVERQFEGKPIAAVKLGFSVRDVYGLSDEGVATLAMPAESGARQTRGQLQPA